MKVEEFKGLWEIKRDKEKKAVAEQISSRNGLREGCVLQWLLFYWQLSGKDLEWEM